MPNNDFNHIKQEVNEITKQGPKISSEDAFIVWFLRAFFTDDQDQAVSALTGGSNDKGIDAILIDDEARTVYFVQGKYHGSSPKRVGRFGSSLKALATCR